MLRMPELEVFFPETLTQAIDIFKTDPENSLYFSGGTDLFPKMKRRQIEGKKLISLEKIPAHREITYYETNGLTLGAFCTLDFIQNHPLVLQHLPGLAQASSLVATSEIQGTATLGGNLMVDPRCTYYDQTEFWRDSIDYCLKKKGDTCWVARKSPICLAVSSTDTAPVLCSLDAILTLLGVGGEREIPIEKLYKADGADYHQLNPGDIITQIRIPYPPDRSEYIKIRNRGSFDFPVCSLALSYNQEDFGKIKNLKAFAGGLHSAPLNLHQSCSLLEGKIPTQNLIKEAADAAVKTVKSLDNTDMVPGYRRNLLGEIFKDHFQKNSK